MPSPQAITEQFWKSLHSDRVFMLGVDGAENGHFRPMTAITEHEHTGPVWIFTAKDTAVARAVKDIRRRAMAAYSAKGHRLFATVHGTIELDQNRAMIEKLWNPFIAAWFDGKNDPKLALLRFEAEHGEIWLNENSVLAGVRMLFGADPTQEYEDKVAKVRLGGSR